MFKMSVLRNCVRILPTVPRLSNKCVPILNTRFLSSRTVAKVMDQETIQSKLDLRWEDQETILHAFNKQNQDYLHRMGVNVPARKQIVKRRKKRPFVDIMDVMQIPSMSFKKVKEICEKIIADKAEEVVEKKPVKKVVKKLTPFLIPKITSDVVPEINKVVAIFISGSAVCWGEMSAHRTPVKDTVAEQKDDSVDAPAEVKADAVAETKADAVAENKEAVAEVKAGVSWCLDKLEVRHLADNSDAQGLDFQLSDTVSCLVQDLPTDAGLYLMPHVSFQLSGQASDKQNNIRQQIRTSLVSSMVASSLLLQQQTTPSARLHMVNLSRAKMAADRGETMSRPLLHTALLGGNALPRLSISAQVVAAYRSALPTPPSAPVSAVAAQASKYTKQEYPSKGVSKMMFCVLTELLSFSHN